MPNQSANKTRCATLVCFILVLLQAGCSFTGTRALSNDQSLNQVTPGISTKSQVKQLFGQPSSQRFSSGYQGGRIWVYEYSRSDVNPLAFIPFMSFALLACCEWHTIETRTLIVEFGSDEVVQRFTRGIITK